MTSPVLLEREDHLAFLTLNRPEALNALDRPTVLALRDAVRGLRDDPQTRVVVLGGSGERAFSVGADLKERRAMATPEVLTLRSLIVETVRELNTLNKPVIAAVRGFALGGGFEVALACDLLIAGEGATFGFPEVTLGIIPGAGGTQTLTRAVGKARAKELIFTGRRFGAHEALQFGVAARVVPDDQVQTAARELAGSIAKNAPLAVQQAKRVMDLGSEVDLGTAWQLEAEAYNLCLLTEDRDEGLRAFAEKRQPQYKGR
ncbi:MAG: enoyl-CoA hydratase/isomerase family protein [Chloroflexota bacterium]|nr:enoyl-CoA hydratase/isomerase family protein [Chloroflexota bacterium]